MRERTENPKGLSPPTILHNIGVQSVHGIKDYIPGIGTDVSAPILIEVFAGATIMAAYLKGFPHLEVIFEFFLFLPDKVLITAKLSGSNFLVQCW